MANASHRTNSEIMYPEIKPPDAAIFCIIINESMKHNNVCSNKAKYRRVNSRKELFKHK